MNWLALDARVFAAALGGCLLALLIAALVEPLAFSPPWLAGVLGGLACAMVARDRSGLRGLVVAAMATWTAALHSASARAEPLAQAILGLHATFEPHDLLGYAIGLASAYMLGRTSLRRDASTRTAGA